MTGDARPSARDAAGFWATHGPQSYPMCGVAMNCMIPAVVVVDLGIFGGRVASCAHHAELALDFSMEEVEWL